MPKRISKKLKDPNRIAAAVVALSTAEEPHTTDRGTISRVMAEMGRKGGKIGGKRRLKTMTSEQRKAAASKAARARWAANER